MIKTAKIKDTKQILMDAALHLFHKQGFSQTSINSIVARAKVSKGAFYHYYSSKDDVLEAIINQFIQRAAISFEKIATNNKLDALEKFKKLMSWPGGISDFKEMDLKQTMKLSSLLTHVDSTVMFDKIQKKFAEKIGPFLLIIFKQGKEEKVLNIKYPEDTCEFFITFMTNFKRKLIIDLSNCKNSSEKFKLVYKRIKFLEDMMDKMLGVPSGSIKFRPEGLKTFKKIFS